VVVGLVLAPPAAAHPFGPPQQVEIEATGQVVEVRWSAEEDDLTALALHLGALDSARSFVYQDGDLVSEESDESVAQTLAKAPMLERYLLGHVVVTQHGQRCRGELRSAESLDGRGAALHFRCTALVDRVKVFVSTLTDVHPDYRTVATSPTGQRTMYSRHSLRHDWYFAAGDDRRQDTVTGGTVALASGVGGFCAALALLARRRHRDRVGGAA